MDRGRKKINILVGLVMMYFASATAYNQAPEADESKATFSIDNPVFDYGTISENGGFVNHTFTIKNTGKEPLIIKQAIATCGCATPTWMKDPIASGKSGEIKVAFNPQRRSGPFSKNISVYCENADLVQLTIKGNIDKNDDDNKAPIFTPNETSHDFGIIGENDGYADHVFKFKNTGTAPLVITRVQTSCGCTQPEWTTAPIAPGEEGYIAIAYNPKGRIGVFDKWATVHTNEDGGFKRHRLTITGSVIEKPAENPHIRYVDTVANVGIEKKDLTYNSLNFSGINRSVIHIKNYRTETTYFGWENVPEHFVIKNPDSLKADWPGQIEILLDGQNLPDKHGRIKDQYDLIIKDKDNRELGRISLSTTANYVDDFSKLSALQRVSAAALKINTLLDFGEIKQGFLGVFGGGSRPITFSNTGKSDLILHSVTSDDSRVHLLDVSGKTIKPGESLKVNVTIKAKELTAQPVDTDIYVVCNDPSSPVRMIKVTAQKAK
jgi:archaellum component FlaG (FlaF/FlaG flagellin family)